MRYLYYLAGSPPVLPLLACGMLIVLSPTAEAGFLGDKADIKVERRVAIAHEVGSGIDVETHNGGIEVRRADVDEVEILAKLKVKNEARAEEVNIDAKRQSDGTLRIRARWPKGKRRDGEACSFEIRVPDARGVQLSSHNGAVSIEGLRGGARLETHNGAIGVEEHGGPVHAETHNGAVKIHGVKGPIEAESHNGRITIRNAQGEVQAETHNGPLDVEMAESSTGPLDLLTSNGSVEISLGASFEGLLTLRTDRGSLRLPKGADVEVLEKSRQRARVQIGESQTHSSVRTNNGSISIRR